MQVRFIYHFFIRPVISYREDCFASPSHIVQVEQHCHVPARQSGCQGTHLEREEMHRAVCTPRLHHAYRSSSKTSQDTGFTSSAFLQEENKENPPFTMGEDLASEGALLASGGDSPAALQNPSALLLTPAPWLCKIHPPLSPCPLIPTISRAGLHAHNPSTESHAK